jgi:hypothetical protein
MIPAEQYWDTTRCFCQSYFVKKAIPFDPTKKAQDVLPGSIKREFPSEYLGKSLNDIKDLLDNLPRDADGKLKQKLQKAKKLLEQQER